MMMRYLATYAATLLVLAVLDFVWLGFIAKPLYQKGIGHLMAADPNFAAALLFYVLFPVGILLFAVLPQSIGDWRGSMVAAAVFGFFCYATYGLTNLATLKSWPTMLVFTDIAWGVLLTTLCAAAGKYVWGLWSAP